MLLENRHGCWPGVGRREVSTCRAALHGCLAGGMRTQGAAALAAGATGSQGPVSVEHYPEVGRQLGGAAEAGGAVSAPETARVQAGDRRAAGVRWRLGGSAEATGSAGRGGFWAGKMHAVLQ